MAIDDMPVKDIELVHRHVIQPLEDVFFGLKVTAGIKHKATPRETWAIGDRHPLQNTAALKRCFSHPGFRKQLQQCLRSVEGARLRGCAERDSIYVDIDAIRIRSKPAGTLVANTQRGYISNVLRRRNPVQLLRKVPRRRREWTSSNVWLAVNIDFLRCQRNALRSRNQTKSLDIRLCACGSYSRGKGDDSEAAKVGRLQAAFQQRIDARERLTGKKLGASELREEAAQLFKPVRTSGFLGFGTDKPAGLVTGKDAVQIPDNERTQIEAALKRAGRPVTDAAVEALYRAHSRIPQRTAQN